MWAKLQMTNAVRQAARAAHSIITDITIDVVLVTDCPQFVDSDGYAVRHEGRTYMIVGRNMAGSLTFNVPMYVLEDLVGQILLASHLSTSSRFRLTDEAKDWVFDLILDGIPFR